MDDEEYTDQTDHTDETPEPVFIKLTPEITTTPETPTNTGYDHETGQFN